MTKPLIKILDLSTNEEIEREMNAEEFAAYKSSQEAIAIETESNTLKAAEKAALLAKLGITDDEAKLLLS